MWVKLCRFEVVWVLGALGGGGWKVCHGNVLGECSESLGIGGRRKGKVGVCKDIEDVW